MPTFKVQNMHLQHREIGGEGPYSCPMRESPYGDLVRDTHTQGQGQDGRAGGGKGKWISFSLFIPQCLCPPPPMAVLSPFPSFGSKQSRDTYRIREWGDSEKLILIVFCIPKRCNKDTTLRRKENGEVRVCVCL